MAGCTNEARELDEEGMPSWNYSCRGVNSFRKITVEHTGMFAQRTPKRQILCAEHSGYDTLFI